MQKIAIIAENLPEKMKSWLKALKNGKPIKINTLIKQKKRLLTQALFRFIYASFDRWNLSNA